jgi:hypothetical protein
MERAYIRYKLNLANVLLKEAIRLWLAEAGMTRAPIPQIRYIILPSLSFLATLGILFLLLKSILKL